MNTRRIGSAGENLAAEFLKDNGYRILERNFSCKFGEVDIIALHDGFYVFVEVKSRNSVSYGLPCQAVTANKQRHIIDVAKYWLVKKRKVGTPVRFDVVEILNGMPSVIQDAFRP